MLKVSPSEMATFRRCRRKWYLTYHQRWTIHPDLAKPTGAAQLGTRIHAALEAYYGYDIDPVNALAVIYDNERERRPEWSAVLTGEQDWGTIMLAGYLEWAAENGVDEEYEVVATERTLDSPILLTNGEMAIVSGKLDQIVRRRLDGAYLLRDWKPQPLSEKVLTPSGGVRMGDIKPGDIITGAKGEPVKVVNVYDRGEDEVFKVTMNDGTSVRATGDHPWLARLVPNGAENVIETSALRRNSRITRFRPDINEPAPDAQLPVEPYLLGAWIANGHRNGSVINDGSRAPMEATGMRVREETRTGRRIQYLACLTPEVRAGLRSLGLLDVGSSDRWIPAQYVHGASAAQRLALLRGLMDGDGCFAGKHRGSAYYSTVSEQLADDVAQLARSLGAWAKVWTSPTPKYTGSVERRVTIKSDFNPFLHADHKAAWDMKRAEILEQSADGRRKNGLPTQDKIVWSVEPDGREAVRCIEVDSDEHLYVTSGYTVTHNTVGTLGKGNMILLDEQMRIYAALLTIHSEGMRVDGALYAMLLRSKRTARANGPFYEQIHISYNGREHMSMLTRIRGTLDDMDTATRRLNAGEDHRLVAYPTPLTDRCAWDCPFRDVCPMFDDGSRIDDALAANFVQADPYAYRNNDLIDEVKAAFGVSSPEGETP